MTSNRHNTYLDAARAAILDVGWKRSTLTDVARRAGVSRMTIYRTWPDMQTLLADLMTREWTEILAAVPPPVDGQPTPEGIAAGITAAIDALRANPLFRRILDLDPELLLPYLLDRRGRSQQAILGFLTPRIAAGQEAGLVCSSDPEVLARTLVLAAHGLTLSAHTMIDGDVSQGDLSGAFEQLVIGALTP
ncbi:MAG: TetR/AcrR family transcriptional regulator [Nocardioides sp.]|nr:TetR/AcrR family transcriptional regulator [Nocardioides sp.]